MKLPFRRGVTPLDSSLSPSISDACADDSSSASLTTLLVSVLAGCMAPPSFNSFLSFGFVIVEGGSMSADVMMLAGVMGV